MRPDESDKICFVCKERRGVFLTQRHKGCSPPGSYQDVPDAAAFKQTGLYRREVEAFNADPELRILYTCGFCFSEHGTP